MLTKETKQEKNSYLLVIAYTLANAQNEYANNAEYLNFPAVLQLIQ